MANNVIKIKRTAVSGRAPNVTSIANTSYISAGELALNMADGVLYTSNGSSLIAIGAQQNAISATSVSASSLNANNVTVDQGISVGNSTVNTSINAVSIFSGNASVNALVNTTFISVSNSTSNSSINPTTIFTGNGFANVSITAAGGTSNIAISKATLLASGVVTVNTTSAHGLTYFVGLTANITGASLPVFNSSNYNVPFTIQSIPSSNSFTFTVTPSQFSSGARRITSISRTNGVATVVTDGAHQIANQSTIFITDNITGPAFSFNTTSATANVVDSTTLRYPNQSADVSFSLSSASYLASAGTLTNDPVLLRITRANSLVVGDKINLSGFSPSSITNGGATVKYSFPIPATATVTAANSTSFTFVLGAKTPSKGQFTSRSGTISGTVARSYDETPEVKFTAHVGQIVSETSIGGNTVSNIPIGLSINQGNLVVKIAENFIYVGNTTIGTIFDRSGPRIQRSS